MSGRISNEEAIKRYENILRHVGANKEVKTKDICEKYGYKEDFARETVTTINLAKEKDWDTMVAWIKNANPPRAVLNWADKEIQELPQKVWEAKKEKERAVAERKNRMENVPAKEDTNCTEINKTDESEEQGKIDADQALRRIADSLEEIAKTLGEINANRYTEIDILRGIKQNTGKKRSQG